MSAEKPNDKKTLIYEAALSLVYENNDLSRIKVADIAARADIGKGTVYEYFDSKEQVIGEAIIYMFTKGIKTCELLIDDNKSFKEAYTMLLQNLSSMSKNRSLYNFMTLTQKDFAVHVTIQKILFRKLEELRKVYFQVVERLVDKSVQEGIIKEKPSRYDWQTAVLCSMTYIFSHKQLEADSSTLTDQEVLDKAYNTYVKLLN